MLGKINNIKQKLHEELNVEELDKEKILEVSKELDNLIAEYCNISSLQKSLSVDTINSKVSN